MAQRRLSEKHGGEKRIDGPDGDAVHALGQAAGFRLRKRACLAARPCPAQPKQGAEEEHEVAGAENLEAARVGKAGKIDSGLPPLVVRDHVVPGPETLQGGDRDEHQAARR